MNQERGRRVQGAIWVAEDWFLFASESTSYGYLRNSTGWLLIGPRGPWIVKGGQRELEGRAIIHPAHRGSSGAGAGIIALWPLPTTPLASVLRTLASTAEGGIVVLDHLLGEPCFAALVSGFDALKSGSGTGGALAATVATLHHGLSAQLSIQPRVDLRAKALAARLRHSATAEQTVGEHAEALEISPDRLRHVFAQAFGLRISQFCAWLKLHATLRYAAAAVEKPSITEAALAGGFADAAHLSNTVRRMFSMKPSDAQREDFRVVAVEAGVRSSHDAASRRFSAASPDAGPPLHGLVPDTTARLDSVPS